MRVGIEVGDSLPSVYYVETLDMITRHPTQWDPHVSNGDSMHSWTLVGNSLATQGSNRQMFVRTFTCIAQVTGDMDMIVMSEH